MGALWGDGAGANLAYNSRHADNPAAFLVLGPCRRSLAGVRSVWAGHVRARSCDRCADKLCHGRHNGIASRRGLESLAENELAVAA